MAPLHEVTVDGGVAKVGAVVGGTGIVGLGVDLRAASVPRPLVDGILRAAVGRCRGSRPIGHRGGRGAEADRLESLCHLASRLFGWCLHRQVVHLSGHIHVAGKSLLQWR